MTEVEQMKSLVRKRGSVKSRLTNFNRYLSDVIQKVTEVNKISEIKKEMILELETRYEALSLLSDEFDNLQNEIEIWCAENDLTKQYDERNAFQDEFYRAVAKARGILDRYNNETENNDSVGGSQTDLRSVIDTGVIQNDKDVPVKLPLINLPTFNGAYTKWLEFKDTFESLIHSNKSIGDIQKFHYLRASLEGSAKQVIESLDFSASNYNTAWEILCKRYDNKRILVRDHISGIYEMQPLKHESSEGLRALVDTVSKHLRALENLGEPVQHWDSLIIFNITTKLDRVTLKEWETFKIKNETPALTDFKEFVSGRADLLETLESSKSKVKENQHFNKQKSFMAVNKTQQQNKRVCIMCRSSHDVSQCKQFLDLPVYLRVAQVKKSKVCLCCFSKNHFSPDCRAVKCSKCGQSHHVLLHYDREFEQGGQSNSNTSTGGGVSQESQTNSGSSQAVTLSSRTFTSRGHVLLSTAMVKIRDASGRWFDCNVLLDSGSMSNFLTESMCQKLRLATGPVKISVVGISQGTSTISKRCEAEIKSNCGEFKISVSCLIIPKISEALPLCEVDVSS